MATSQQGRRASKVPIRIKNLLQTQEGKCSRCTTKINTQSYFDFSNELTCGTCALKSKEV